MSAAMTRAYDNRGFLFRSWLSVTILTGAFCWGLWEMWQASQGAGDTNGYLFGAGFIGGALYGAYTMLRDTRDVVIRLETDPAGGRAAVVLWRPWGMLRLEGPSDLLTGWRFHIAFKGRNQRAYYLYASHPARPRPLQFELPPQMTALDGLRALAPEAVADFEAARGGKTGG